VNIKIHTEIMSDQKAEAWANLDIDINRYGNDTPQAREYDRFLMNLAAQLTERARVETDNFLLSIQARKEAGLS
jgi:hypothetical protein